MKCSHCEAPVSLRSRHCPKCGAPQDITVRHRQELDANIGAVVRRWVMDEIASRVSREEWKNATPYEQATMAIDHVARVRRDLAGEVEKRTRPRALNEAPRMFDVNPGTLLFHEVVHHLNRFIEQTRIDHLLSEIERVLRDERYDIEHERVMARTE